MNIRRPQPDPRLIHYYARFADGPSGVTESIENWAAESSEVLHVEIWCAAPRRDHRTSASGKIRYIPHLGRSRTTWIPISLIWLLRPQDVIYIHEGWVFSNFFAALVARVRGTKIISMPHGVYEPQLVAETRDPTRLRRLLERLTLRNVSLLHVFYASEVPLAEKISGRNMRNIAFPNGTPEPQTMRKWDGAGDYFLWLGRFDPVHKGLDHLVDFWKRLPEPRPALRMHGPDFLGGKARVAALVTSAELGSVISLGPSVSGDEKSELMQHCRAYLHPSRWESCSITLLEFLATGAPVLVSSRIHAATELEAHHVVVSCDFSEGQPSRFLGSVDRSTRLGDSARAWAQEQGRWAMVGGAYRAWLKEWIAP